MITYMVCINLYVYLVCMYIGSRQTGKRETQKRTGCERR